MDSRRSLKCAGLDGAMNISAGMCSEDVFHQVFTNRYLLALIIDFLPPEYAHSSRQVCSSFRKIVPFASIDLDRRIRNHEDSKNTMMERFFNMLGGNTTLFTVTISDFSFPTQLLASALKQNNTLRTLNMGDNYIGEEETKYLTEALSRNSSLTSLDLYSNYADVALISQMMKRNSSITYLSLCYNHVEDSDTHHLRRMLEDENGNALLSLDLQRNRITDQGIYHIAEGLKRNETLTKLDLGNNRFGTEGAAHLAKSLEMNSTLKYLSLYGNQISGEGVLALAKSLRNSSLLFLGLGHFDVEEDEMELLSEVLKERGGKAGIDP
eukprot:TRINITY_DN10254_c0_g1_i1.p1 TRINITY_DN10254_c0_g1~~TRINITY_DN10254_c0_g1_i1.p1  ORF type:complete len:324 (+),score=21.66 TRINITY_DN10254_c0_g1_i1:89-1060(+)